MSTQNGKCHCGQLQWTVKFDDKQPGHILCHCNTCKALGGGAFSLNQIVPKGNLLFYKGTPKEYIYYGESGKAVHCYYCPNCTSHAYHHQEVMGDNIIVRTILLDGGPKMDPAAEIFGKDRLPWEKEVATTYEVMPPS